MFLFVRRLVAGRIIAKLSARYSRLPLVIAGFGILRVYLRRRQSHAAVVTLKKGEKLVVTREVESV